MECTRVVLALVATTLITTTSVSGQITTTIQSNQQSRQPQLGSTVLLTCTIAEEGFYRSLNKNQWLKQQYGEMAWYNVTTNLDARYAVLELAQKSATEFKTQLTITGFQAADAGTYRCMVTSAAQSPGKLFDDLTLSTSLQSANVQVSTSAPCDANSGVCYYESKHQVSTSCVVSFVGTADVVIQATYNGHDHYQEFTLDKKVVLEGTTAGMKVVRQTITLASHTFRPVTRTPTPLSCIASAADDNRELGRGSLSVALKSLPNVACIQSGEIPAYLYDLNVMITCTAQDYDWHPTSRFVFSFTALESGEPTTIVVDGSVEKQGRTKVDDMKDGKHSLHINRVTSDVAQYPVYNVTLLEEDQILASTPFTLNVLNKGRSSEFVDISEGAAGASASFLAVLFSSVVAMVKPW